MDHIETPVLQAKSKEFKKHLQAILALLAEIQDDAEHRSRLLARLVQRRRILLEVPGDGHCQFRAVALINGGTHEQLRAKVVLWLRENKEWNPSKVAGCELHNFQDGDWDTFCNDMAGTAWGNQLTLLAMANILNTNIRVISSSVDTEVIMIRPEQDTTDTITIAHRAERHYDATVIPEDDTYFAFTSLHDQRVVKDRLGVDYSAWVKSFEEVHEIEPSDWKYLRKSGSWAGKIKRKSLVGRQFTDMVLDCFPVLTKDRKKFDMRFYTSQKFIEEFNTCPNLKLHGKVAEDLPTMPMSLKEGEKSVSNLIHQTPGISTGNLARLRALVEMLHPNGTDEAHQKELITLYKGHWVKKNKEKLQAFKEEQKKKQILKDKEYGEKKKAEEKAKSDDSDEEDDDLFLGISWEEEN